MNSVNLHTNHSPGYFYLRNAPETRFKFNSAGGTERKAATKILNYPWKEKSSDQMTDPRVTDWNLKFDSQH